MSVSTQKAPAVSRPDSRKSATPSHLLPWQRVIGAEGEIKLRFEAGAEQRLRLQIEGVTFRGTRVNLAAHQHVFPGWEPE
jgi:methylated-DNA-protein-cysteine methyltransferase related protein